MRLLALMLLVVPIPGCMGICSPACSSCGYGGPGECSPVVCVEHCHYRRMCDDLHSGLAARRCAWEALAHYGPVSHDFRRGFIDAHVDLAHGATGAIPPVPPERYWSTCFRTPGGHARASEWFSGYAAGVAHARATIGRPTVPSSGAFYDCGPAHGRGGHAMPYGCPPEWGPVP